MTSAMRHIISEAVLWLAIFIIALAAFLFLDNRLAAYLETNSDASSQMQQDEPPLPADQPLSPASVQESGGHGRVILQGDRSGHFNVNAYINDRSISLLADTGATYVVLTYEDAEALDLTHDLEFTGRASTANGISKVAPLLLDTVEVGDIRVDNVQAFVAEAGKLKHSLLGMSFIGRLESFQMSGRELILVQ